VVVCTARVDLCNTNTVLPATAAAPARTASSPATTEVHHSPDWTPHGATDADKLFFACGPDHKRVTDGHYHTSLTDTGRLAWTDGTTPPDINHAHHPEELLHGNTDPPHNDVD
jgi:hypothetical protein